MRIRFLPITVALAILAGAMPLPSFAEPAPRETWPHLDAVREILGSDASDAATRLSRLGPSAAPTVWAVLSGQVLADTDLDQARARELLREGLTRWPATPTVTELTHAAREDTPLGDRLLLVEILGWTESEAALPAIFEVLAGAPEVELHSRRVTSSLPRALAPLIASDPRRLRELADLLPQLPPALYPALIETAAREEHEDAMRVLVAAARRGDEPARLALVAIGQRPRPLTTTAAREAIDLARSYLAAPMPRHRRLAAAALGRLHDVPSFPELIERLADDDAVVRRVAGDALGELAGVERRWSAARWTRWWDEENAWLHGAGPLGAEAREGTRARAKSAIRTLSMHSLFGEEVAEILADGLRHSDGAVRESACGGLARLDHPAAIPLLLDALCDGEETVATSAHRALTSLTGVDHGPVWGAWNDWWRTLQ